MRARSWTMPVSTGSLGEPRAKRCKHCDGNCHDEDYYVRCTVNAEPIMMSNKFNKKDIGGFNSWLFVLLGLVFVVLSCVAVFFC